MESGECFQNGVEKINKRIAANAADKVFPFRARSHDGDRFHTENGRFMTFGEMNIQTILSCCRKITIEAVE